MGGQLTIQRALEETAKLWKKCPLELINDVIGGEFLAIKKTEITGLYISDLDEANAEDIGLLDMMKSWVRALPTRSFKYDFGEFVVTQIISADHSCLLMTPWGWLACHYDKDIDAKFEMELEFDKPAQFWKKEIVYGHVSLSNITAVYKCTVSQNGIVFI